MHRDHIYSFIPNWLTGLLSKTGKTTSTTCEVIPGAVMFVDVSGFTPLSENLARMGKEGAEELTRVLNSYFDDMIEIIYSYGGDVCNFGGDSMRIIFGNSPELDPADFSLKVISCAYSINKKMDKFRSIECRGGYIAKLEIKIGISSGDIYTGIIGEASGKMDYFTAGFPVFNSATSESQAKPGEIIVDENFAELLNNNCNMVEKDGFFKCRTGGDIQPSKPEWKTNLLRLEQGSESAGRFIQQDLRKYIQSGTMNWINEHRKIAVLFLQFSGINLMYPDRDIIANLDRFYTGVNRIVSGFGGNILSLDLGDKGNMMLLVFGAPTSYEDTPLRSLYASLEMKKFISSLDFIDYFRIGITYEKAFCGFVGAEIRKVYTVMGDFVNLAARLMTKAEKKDILAHETLLESAKSEFKIKNVAPFNVKGKSDKINAFLLLSSSDADGPHKSASLIGREDFKRKLLGKAGDCLKNNKGCLISLYGNAGTGKTAITLWFQSELNTLGFNTYYFNCHSSISSIPFYPWKNIFRSILGLKNIGDPGLAAEIFKNRCSLLIPEFRTLFPLLSDFVGLQTCDNAEILKIDEKIRKSKLINILLVLLERISSESPVGIRLENFSHLDSNSKEFLKELKHHLEANRIIITVTHREKDDISSLGYSDPVESYFIDRLTDTEFKEFVGYVLGNSPDDELLELIERNSERNPLFIKEIIESLKRSGGIEQMSSGRYRLTEGKNPHLSDNLQALALSHIDKIENKARVLLKAASCIGTHFKKDELGHILDEKNIRDNIDTILEHLESERIIEKSPDSNGEYEFVSNIYQHSAYETLNYSIRRKFHLKLADYYETGTNISTSVPKGVIAFHYYHAENYPKSYEYSYSAAREARDLYANRETIEFLQQALDISTNKLSERNISREIEIIRDLGTRYMILGDFERALRYFETGESISSESSDKDNPKLVLDFLLRKSAIYIRRNQYDTARGYLMECLETARKSDLTEEEGKALMNLGYITFQIGDYKKSEDYLKKASDIFSNLSMEKEEASCCFYRGYGFLKTGDIIKAKNYFLSALKLIENDEFNADSIRYLNGLADVNIHEGNYGEAEHNYLEALKKAEKFNDKSAKASCFLSLGSLNFNLAKLKEASDWYEKSRLLFRELGTVSGVALCSNNIAAILTLNGNYDGALISYQEAYDVHLETGDKAGQALALYNLGELFILKKDFADAIRYFDDAISLFRELNDLSTVNDCMSLKVYAMTCSGKKQEALNIIGKIFNSDEALQTDDAKGWLYRSLGKINGDEDSFRKSINLFQAQGNNFQLAFAYREFGNYLDSVSRTEEAEIIHIKADDIFRQYENTSELRN